MIYITREQKAIEQEIANKKATMEVVNSYIDNAIEMEEKQLANNLTKAYIELEEQMDLLLDELQDALQV